MGGFFFARKRDEAFAMTPTHETKARPSLDFHRIPPGVTGNTLVRGTYYEGVARDSSPGAVPHGVEG